MLRTIPSRRALLGAAALSCALSAPAPAQDAAPAACTVETGSGGSLDEAKALFATSCPGIPRRDCDPLGGGGWQCSSGVIGNAAPGLPAPASPPPASPVADAPEQAPAAPEPEQAPEPPAAPTSPAEPATPTACVTAPAASLDAARRDYAASCALPRVDCDPLADGRWVCSSANIDSRAPSGADNPPTPTAPTAPTPEAPANPPVPTVGNGDGGSTGRIGSDDLLALHYDNCPDRDDGHALAAGKAVVEKAGLSNVVVVNGTCGDGIRDRYQRSSEAVARAVWGGEVLDAFDEGTTSDSPATVAAADRWAATLAAGGDVWVAEGGPSDFTARVLQRLGSVYPALDRKRVKVVQHSSGSAFNEAKTSSSGIALVKSAASYITIPNGNVGGNGSADLNSKSSFFVATARASRYASEWNAAFAYLDPNDKLDFSDTVELLYIIDERSTQSVDDFARRYLQ